MSEAEHARAHRWVAATPAIAATAVGAMGLLVLAGWATDVEVLKSMLHPARVAMNPTTAASFILLAATLWLLRRDRPVSALARRVAQVLAGVVIVVALLRLGAYAGFSNVRVDGLLFAARLGTNVMAPNTALAFLLIAPALLLLDLPPVRGRFNLSQPLTLATAAVATLSLVGYLYDVSTLYGVRGSIPMALNTAIAFLLLAIGTLCSRPGREPLSTALGSTLGGVVARRLIPGAFLLPVFVGWLLLQGWTRDLYDAAFGMTLFVLSIILVFNALVWWSARVIRRTDITRRRTEAELRLSEQRYHAVMQQTAEGIYLVDLETYRVTESNAAFEKLLGYRHGELDGRSVFDLIDDAPERIAARLAVLEDTRMPLQGERTYRRKDGSTVDVYVGATVISYGSRSVACTVLHDVTERRAALRTLQAKHDELERAVAAERDALAKLRLAQSRLVQSEKLASLGQMVAGVAHEINNPLSFVSNNVAVLQRDTKGLCQLLALYAQADDLLAAHRPELQAEIRDLAERMDLAYTQSNLNSMMARSRDGLRRIQQIVKDLRDFARLDESDLHEVDLNSGIESTVNIVAGRAKKKRVEIHMNLAPLPLVACFPAKVNQVVMNLVANAIDACPEGGHVNVRTHHDHGVHIVVADNGPGVPASIRERIFDPFFTTKPQGEGTGLGLSISYGIVHDHGGQIELSDTPGGGATFTVTLPMRKIAKDPQRVAH